MARILKLLQQRAALRVGPPQMVAQGVVLLVEDFATYLREATKSTENDYFVKNPEAHFCMAS